MPRRHRFQAVVFDLDGTLIDSAPDIADALNMVMAELGRVGFTDRMIREMVGTGWTGLIDRALDQTGGMPEQGVDWFNERFRHHYVPRSTRLSSVYPTVRETIETLHGDGVALGICTNKRQVATDIVVREFGLLPFMGAVVGGDTGVMKPDPRHIGVVLERLGVEPADAIMIGDSRADLDAAKGLDMPCVLVRYGYTTIPVEELGGDRLIDRMDELHTVLPEL
ncbi:MAG: HAD-IA family hydrolase [Rhodospirillales bacterium]|nr:HAD-IA family hydrolase [Rhodospirillales bacterium]